MISRDTLRDVFKNVEGSRMVSSVDQGIAAYAQTSDRYDYARRCVVPCETVVRVFTPRDLAREGLRLLLELEHAEALLENAERDASASRQRLAERWAARWSEDLDRILAFCELQRRESVRESLTRALGWRVAGIFGKGSKRGT